ncbi:DUF2334 domain-containing protein [Amycolatopsis sp. BJA-103]|uniref:DUF2334 domain-containing protein n=1 Tax=unclassified Amycolatopsis TaxID=2618356 RepID=UPI000C770C7D|nr:DUF2334 domain-containing protein [Amycolatopsis sp. BJA-103]AUI60087.1 hypothetical protein BKN51_19040 [Amycolatopsis sp. BJA-103]PNE14414.1 hypothetical protein B1H26_35245 [Amycolatopsis sp. BJA-103]
MTKDKGTQRFRLPAWFRLAVVAVVAVTVAVVVLVQVTKKTPVTASPPATPVSLAGRAPEAGKAGLPGPGGDPDRRTLVLYDDGRKKDGTTSPPDEVKTAEAYAMFTANLVSRGTAWKLQPAADYRPRQADEFQAIVYLGSIYDASLPKAFLTDVTTTRIPVVWIGANIWQLHASSGKAAGGPGWRAEGYRDDNPTTVTYKGTPLRRDPRSGTGVVAIDVRDRTKVQILAEASAPGGTPSPWAVHSGQLTYLAEVPYAYAEAQDRYLAAADILLGVLSPQAPDRHRALVRLEDVGPRTKPEELRRITDFLIQQQVPFSLAVYPYYSDPQGRANNGDPTSARLVDSPELVGVLKDAVQAGATLIMHGYSHQSDSGPNPYDGVSASDFEFYKASVDGEGVVHMDGPMPEDSAQWFDQRIATGLGEFRRVGLPEPTMFEFPHYGGSAVDYQQTTALFQGRYDRGSYYAGFCPGGRCGSTATATSEQVYGQFFPYPVRDVYGANVVPENIGNVAPIAFNQHAARTAVDMLADAQSALVVRDNVASFFYHPFLGEGGLRDLVNSLRALGYRFVTPAEILDG